MNTRILASANFAAIVAATAAVLFAAGTMAAPAPTGVPVYTVTPLTTNAAAGLRINQSGDIAGWTLATFPAQPILITPENGVIVLPTSTSQPYGIARDLCERTAGYITVVGEAKLNSSASAIHAVRWRVALPQGTMIDVTDLGVLPGQSESFANAVNSAGLIAGTSDPNSWLSVRAFIYSDAAGMADLGLGAIGTNAVALDLNVSGVVTGYLGLQAFRWSATGGFQNLGAPAGWADSFGFAINASGQVAGSASSAYGNAEVVVRYTDGSGWQVLGGTGEHNRGSGINQWGDVVGTMGEGFESPWIDLHRQPGPARICRRSPARSGKLADHGGLRHQRRAADYRAGDQQ